MEAHPFGEHNEVDSNPYNSTEGAQLSFHTEDADGHTYIPQRTRSRGSLTSLRRSQCDQLSGQPGYDPGNLGPEGEDLANEILAMNTVAMQRCKTATLDEATRILGEAYMKLNDDHGRLIRDASLLDQLKSMTMNNMGIAECQRGQHRQALSHFEGARQLEENWNVVSPSVALNMCAAYNALRMYDKATAAALETIDMLRTLELQRKRDKKMSSKLESGGWDRAQQSNTLTVDKPQLSEEEEQMLAAAAQPKVTDSDNKALWGAAWHNLAVAQVNTVAHSKDMSEHTNTLVLFQNAMQATQELLGMRHPMTKSVIETYRYVRGLLRKRGAFRQHRTRLTAPLPPVDPREQEIEELGIISAKGRTHHSTLELMKKDLTITFRGDATGMEKLTERVERTPYPGAREQPYQRKGGTSRRPKKEIIASALRNIPFGGTLLQASAVYGNPHPLLYSSPLGGEMPPYGMDIDMDPFPTEHRDYRSAPTSARTGSGSRRHHTTYAAPFGGVAGVSRKNTDSYRASEKKHRGGTGQFKQAVASKTTPAVTAVDRHPLPLLAEASNTYSSPRSRNARTVPSHSHGASNRSVPQATGHQGKTVAQTSGRSGQRSPFNRKQLDPSVGDRKTGQWVDSGDQAHSTEFGSGGSGPIARNTHFEQSRFLLLAQPPATASMNTIYSTLDLGPPAAQLSKQHLPGPAAASSVVEGTTGPIQGVLTNQQTQIRPPTEGFHAVHTADYPETVSNTHSQQCQSVEGADSGVTSPRELFGAMWMSAEPAIVRQGKRIIGRPGYYVSTIMNVDTDGKETQNTQRWRAAPILSYSSSGSSSSGSGSRRESSDQVAQHDMVPYTSDSSASILEETAAGGSTL